MRKPASGILKIAASVAVSLLAGYLALRNVELEQVLTGIRQADIALTAVVPILIAAAQVVRSLRWGLLLEPLQPVSQRLLLPITCVGFLFVWILPARLGEMARPYLLGQNSDIGLTSAMGSVVLERIIDAVFLTGLLALCLPALQIPGWLLSSFQGFVSILVVVALLLLLGSGSRFRGWLLRIASKFLPATMCETLQRAGAKFYSGMQAASSGKKLAAVLTLTLVIWGMGVVTFMALFKAMGLELGWFAAINVMVWTCIGIALPAAPGFIGNYHYACVVALTLFGILKETALAYAILIHFLTVVVLVVMGVVCINVPGLKLGFPVQRHRLAREE
ncbi:MAG: flippase-like domain-containing protein [Deltaproteobacteria bacterium]|nr:MAG: flippase-like domain-containing protein [Deltaproteobacteria bacterium]